LIGAVSRLAERDHHVPETLARRYTAARSVQPADFGCRWIFFDLSVVNVLAARLSVAGL
jgi:hypothetical protein